MEKKLSLKERLIVLFGGVTPAEAVKRAREAFAAGMEDGQDEPALYTADGKQLGTGYKTVRSTPRDLSAISQEKAIEASYRLWQSHPLAKALIEIYVDYVLGSGATVKADNPDVQTLLDTFWRDPVNALGNDDGGIGEGQDELARELFLFGEQVILTFVRSGADVGAVADGLVRFGTVDPKSIHSVITDANNRRDVLAIRLKSKTGGADGPVYKIIREDGAGRAMEGRIDLGKFREAVQLGRQKTVDGRREFERRVSGKEWIVSEDGQRQIRMAEAEKPVNDAQTAGECFYARINKISTGVRGRPELLPMIDWLDRYDQLFFDGAEHVALLNMFSWDLTIQGGSEKATEPELNLKAQAQKVSKMKPGSVYAHNEKATLEAKNPSLNTADLETMVRQLRVFISGGARVPEHFIAEGGYTNRACYSEDTETLTEKGWRKYWEVESGEKIATFNPETGKMEYHQPYGELHLYDYQGEMVHFHNKMVDILVTPDHRMWAKRARNSSDKEYYETIRAEEIQVSKWNFRCAADWQGEDILPFFLPAIPYGVNGARAEYPETTLAMDDWLEFLGYWISEGHARKHSGQYIVSLSQNMESNGEKALKIGKCLESLPFNFTRSIGDDGMIRWATNDKQLNTWLRENCGEKASGKRLPDFVWGLSKRQLKILFDALMVGDGTIDFRQGRSSGAYYTSSSLLADDVQRLAFLLGHRAKRTTSYPAHGNKSEMYRIFISFDTSETHVATKAAIKRESYSGKVYCFEVPHHLFVTRRNGKVTIQGNTAESMGDPTFKMLTKKQAIVRQMFTRLCRYQVDVAVGLGLLPEEVPVVDESGEQTDKTALAREAFRVVMPDINVKDTSLAARSLALVAQAVMPLVAAQFLPKKPALQLVAAMASILGVEIDVEAALADAEGVPAVDPGILDLLKKLGQGSGGAGEPGNQGNDGQGDMGGLPGTKVIPAAGG